MSKKTTKFLNINLFFIKGSLLSINCDLILILFRDKFIFELEWEKNSLAIWDNRSMLHQATPFNGIRKMYRITIK